VRLGLRTSQHTSPNADLSPIMRRHPLRSCNVRRLPSRPIIAALHLSSASADPVCGLPDAHTVQLLSSSPLSPCFSCLCRCGTTTGQCTVLLVGLAAAAREQSARMNMAELNSITRGEYLARIEVWMRRSLHPAEGSRLGPGKQFSLGPDLQEFGDCVPRKGMRLLALASASCVAKPFTKRLSPRPCGYPLGFRTLCCPILLSLLSPKSETVALPG
jgi:hypothetical protein